MHLCNQTLEVAQPRSLTFDAGESKDSYPVVNNTKEQDDPDANVVVTANDKQLALESHFCNDYGLDLDSSLKTSLKYNAIAAYTSLVSVSIGKNKYGRALKFLKIALSCLGMFDRFPVC